MLGKLRRPSPTLERLLEIHEALQFQGFFARLLDPPRSTTVGRCVTIELHLETLPRSSGRGLPGVLHGFLTGYFNGLEIQRRATGF